MTTAPLLSHLIPTAPGTRLTIEQTINVIEEGVTITPRAVNTEDTAKAAPAATAPTAYLAYTSESWTWQNLRDYVRAEIEKILGYAPPAVPDFKAKAIFEGFLNRHGEYASKIARYAFEVADGYWKNAPISVNRFCLNSDPYFAIPIKNHLIDVERAAANT